MAMDDFSTVDVVSNTLGIIILVTLLCFFFYGHSRFFPQDSDGMEQDNNILLATSLYTYEPIPLYYLAYNGRLIELPMVDAANRMESENQWTVPTSIGTYSLRHFGIIKRDIACYNLTITLDEERLKNLPGEYSFENFKAKLFDQYRENRVAPMFFVHPSGYEAFIPVYRDLLKQKVRFRWRPMEQRQKSIKIYFGPSSFSDPFAELF